MLFADFLVVFLSWTDCFC